MELQKLSDTRWVARYASVNAVCRTFDSILSVMEDVADGSDIDKAIEARGLYHQIHSFSFIVSLVTFDKILSCTKHLSDQLQGKTVDLSIATDLILATKSLLSDLRSQSTWDNIYRYASQIADLHCIEIQPFSIPRSRKRPARLDDSIVMESVGFREIPSTTDTYKTSFYYPILDKFLQELESRFENNNLLIMKGVAACTPSSQSFLSFENLKAFAMEYAVSTEGLEIEVKLVKKSLENTRETVDSLTSFYNYLRSSRPAFAQITLLTKISLTIAVTSVSCERSFSSLKIIKNRLRSTMTEDRLSDLAVLAIEREIAKHLDLDEIVDKFAATDKNRWIFLK